MSPENQTASIYDIINAKPKTLLATQRNYKQLFQNILTALESKNKVIRGMQAEIDRLTVNYKHTNDRLTEHEHSGRHVLPIKTAEEFHD